MNVYSLKHRETGTVQSRGKQGLFFAVFPTRSVFFFAVSPTFITKPFNKTVTEGVTVSLLCEATGNPTPKIAWMKDGETLTSGDTLSFETNRTFSGEYWCLAENGLQPTVNTSAHIDVQCKYYLHSQMEIMWTAPDSNFDWLPTMALIYFNILHTAYL